MLKVKMPKYEEERKYNLCTVTYKHSIKNGCGLKLMVANLFQFLICFFKPVLFCCVRIWNTCTSAIENSDT